MNQVFNVIGIMSGTSLDGVDVAWCKFIKINNKWTYSLIEGITYPYNKQWKNKLSQLHLASAEDFSKTDFDLGRYFGDCVNSFVHRTKAEPDFISSHGHTIFHQPENGFTAQIGGGAAIAAITGLDVVCDFRSLDVALGGQGAPLVPIGDELLFGEYNACLNLGGIANISFKKNESRIAGDICFCNMALNYLAEKSGQDFDFDGLLARKGSVDENLLNKLNSDDFLKMVFPKSIGKEYFESAIKPLLLNSKVGLNDQLRTIVKYIVENIRTVLIDQKLNKGKMLVTGGGSFNTFLLEEMKNQIDIQIVLPGKNLIGFKEALIFAFIGTLRWNNEINVLNSVTGSGQNHIGGCIYKGAGTNYQGKHL